MGNKEYIEDLPIHDKITYKYQLTKDDILSKDGLYLIQCMVRDGMTMDAVAKSFGVSPQTFWAWRKQNKDLRDACARGKQLVDYKVENALLKAALGYKTESVKTIIKNSSDKEGNRDVSIEKTINEVGPSVTACLAWLNNRKPEQWKKNRDSVFELDDKQSGITINIVKGKKEDESIDDEWKDVEE